MERGNFVDLFTILLWKEVRARESLSMRWKGGEIGGFLRVLGGLIGDFRVM